MTRSMRQSELGEHESSGIACPKGCGHYQNLAGHWGNTHDEPFPDGQKAMTDSVTATISENVPTGPMPDGVKEKISEAHRGKTQSEEHNRAAAEAQRGVPLSEEHKQKLSEALSGEDNPFYGKSHSKEARKKMSAAHSGKTIPKERRDELAEEMVGEGNPFYGESHTEEVRELISAVQSTRTEAQQRAARKSPSEETRRKLSEAHTGKTLSEEHARKLLRSGSKPVQVIPTRHTVRSSWEREIDLLLYDGGFNAKYEPETFEIGGGRKYTPDFKVGDTIVEIKGYNWKDADTRAELFMESHPEYRYIVVGTELPADVHIPWDERGRLTDVLAE